MTSKGESKNGDTEFSRRLGSLGEDGGNILVVGAVPRSVHTSVGRQLLGESTGDRRQLLVNCSSESLPEERLPSDTSRATRLQVIDHEPLVRSAASVDAGTAGPEPGPNGTGWGTDTEQTVEGNLGDLGATISQTIDTLDAVGAGLDSGELRLCLDGVDVLLTEYERARVVGFFHLLTERIRKARGLAHYHLPIEREHQLTSLLESLFDVVVELRVQNGHPEQRWRFDDFTSEWLPVSAPARA